MQSVYNVLSISKGASVLIQICISAASVDPPSITDALLNLCSRHILSYIFNTISI